jgi:TM2 domain-containing membrane protein YozV
MNTARKAALFNLLLFPGWGQIYLKRYKKGIAIILTFIAAILFVLWSIVQATIAFLKISPFKKGTVTIEAVLKLTVNSIKALNLTYFFLLLFLVVLLWAFSIIDAYQTGKKEMTKYSTTDESI